MRMIRHAALLGLLLCCGIANAATVTKTICASACDYTTVAGWAADLDNATYYAAGDDAVGKLTDNAAYSWDGTMSTYGNTVGLNSATLEPDPTVQYNGKPGTGARLSMTSKIQPNSLTYTFKILNLEIDWGGGSVANQAIRTNLTVFGGDLIHGIHATGSLTVFWPTASTGQVLVYDTAIYDITSSGVGAALVIINSGGGSGAGGYSKWQNDTIDGISVTDSTATIVGVSVTDDSQHEFSNLRVGDMTGAGGSVQDYDNSAPSAAVINTDSSDDSTSPTSALRNATYAYTNASSGDLSLASGDGEYSSPAGSNLGNVAAAVDISGHNRYTAGDTWATGAWQPAASSSGLLLLRRRR